MAKWLRRLRGALGTALTWAAAWAPIGAVVGLGLYSIVPAGPSALASVVLLNAATFGALGFIGGAIFAPLLHWMDGRKQFHQLSARKFGFLGAAGGLCLGGIAVAAGLWGAGLGAVGAGMVGAAALLGSGSAVGSLALARRAENQERLAAGANGSSRGLPPTEGHSRLGDGS